MPSHTGRRSPDVRRGFPRTHRCCGRLRWWLPAVRVPRIRRVVSRF